jgi:DNA invertase Pin-like site-specific DNA recombinase
MKLVAYLRVSTEGQAEDGYGLDVQRSQIEKWAKAHTH